jgi:DNA-binding MarR family transcriptional regulator
MSLSITMLPRKLADTKAWLSVARAYNLCDTALAVGLSEIGLRVGEHEVLANVLLTPGLTQQTLAERCFVAKSGISMLLSRMESQGLLSREADAKDGRIKRLSLSAKGEALARSSLAIQDAIVTQMMSALSSTQVQAMSELAARVATQLESMLDTQLPR